MLKIYLASFVLFLSAVVHADSPPAKLLSVGAISINPCQEAKVLADWYARLGIETQEFQGGYYGQFDTAAGPFVFGIHPRRADAPKQCQPSVSVVFRVEHLDASLATLKERGLLPESTEADDQGKFAHFRDPDGNKVSLWEGT